MTIKDLHNQIQLLDSKIDKLLSLVTFNNVNDNWENINSSYYFFDWLDEWYNVYKVPYLKSNSLGTIDVAIRVHIKKYLPNAKLNLITGLDLQKFLINIKQSRTRKNVYDVLNAVFREAYNLKLIKDNPMQGVKIPSHIRVKGQPLDNNELENFMIIIKGHQLEYYFKFLLYSGCRRIEGIYLNKRDIDFQNKIIYVYGTKTESSKRCIPLFDNIAALLVKVKPSKDGFYFPFCPDYPTHVFKKFCPNHKLHDLRHTFATLCLAAKVPLKVVQIWLGHSEIDTTANIYTHVTKEINHVEAKTFDNFLKIKALGQKSS